MNLILECLYDDLVDACFLIPGPSEFKDFAVKFFQGGGFPMPSARLGKTLAFLADNGVFQAGASLTGTFAYRVYYSGFFCLPPVHVHGVKWRSLIGSGKWDADELHLICHESRRGKTVGALSGCMESESSISWRCGRTGVRIVLERRRVDPVRQMLAEFLSRDQTPMVVCYGHGIPVAVPDPNRMAIWRLCSALFRKNAFLRGEDRVLACALIPSLEPVYFMEIFGQLAEHRELREMLEKALDVDISGDLKERCRRITERGTFQGKLSWKRKDMGRTIYEKIAFRP